MKSVFAFSLLIIFLLPTSDISMLGIKIFDSRESVDNLKLEVVGKEPGITKYRTEDGNDLSVTVKEGKVVYMENDWLEDPKNRKPLFSDFSFGQTSLKDIRDKFKTNGFGYKKRMVRMTDDVLIDFSCFEFAGRNNEVLVLITTVSLKEELTKENVHEKLKLEAVILADKGYLDKIWGVDKVYSDGYKKIKL